MIHVIATFELKPGRRDEFLKAFAKLAPLVHKEKGCIEYGAAVDVASGIPVQNPLRADGVTVIEKWESTQALQRHLAYEPVAAFLKETGPMVKGLSLQVLEPA